MTDIFIGIDPGLGGAVAVLGRKTPHVFDMPTVVVSKTGFVKRAVDVHGLAVTLRPYASDHLIRCKVQVAIERVNAFPGQGVGSMFSLGMSYWGAVGVIAALGLPLELVEAKDWKAHFRLSKDKEMARGLASRLYPDVDLSHKKDHGRAEALLIARYAMEKL